MSADLSGLTTSGTAGAATYMEEIILQNEALLLEVEQLRSLVKGKGLDQLHRLRDENESLRQQLKLSESKLAERTHQLEVLEAAYDRFDGVHSVMQELTEQRNVLSEMREQCATLEQQNSALKSELVKLSHSEDEARSSLQETEQRCQMLKEEAIKLRVSMEKMKSDLATIETSKCSAERALEEAKLANAELRAHSQALENKCEALNARLCETECEAREYSRIKTEKQIGAEKELQELRDEAAARETRLRAVEQLRAELQEELRVTKAALAAQEESASKALLQQRDQLEETLRRESAELRQALEARERSLREQLTQNMVLKEEVTLLSAEKELLRSRQQELPPGVSRLKKRLKELSDETSKKEALQQRFQNMLTSSTATNSDIKHLFEQMLDYQERRDEEMLTMVAVERIKKDDMEKVYEGKLGKLHAELKNLTYEIHTLKNERGGAVAEIASAGSLLLSPGATQDGAVAAGGNQRQRPLASQANVKAPVPSVPNETLGPVARAGGGGDGVGGSDSNVLDNLWRPLSERADGGNATVQSLRPVPLCSPQVRHAELLVCSRCTLHNKPGSTVCEACGFSL
ncbi:uncharacterized protein Tco025E_02370 [Trypanosoma conorhini]|uniref:RanBP2-type domain-containing protein n=1 Tax=Trypanosoma conorhini TaxID=83891 RepID=A0A3R7PT22_9TRYP|nr:uncharacterized protein Tco025E_02370 [Trypanosoma conorhini]RNF24690.1 hypothetical protein Tco025E_02370 [Trypanosoma conorhini]